MTSRAITSQHLSMVVQVPGQHQGPCHLHPVVKLVAKHLHHRQRRVQVPGDCLHALLLRCPRACLEDYSTDYLIILTSFTAFAAPPPPAPSGGGGMLSGLGGMVAQGVRHATLLPHVVPYVCIDIGLIFSGAFSVNV